VTVVGPWAYSRRILFAFTLWTISYVRNRTSWNVRQLWWNHDPYLIDWVSEHTVAARLRHLHQKRSRHCGIALQVMSRPQVSHVIWLRIRPVSLRNWMAILKSKNRCRKNRLFTAPSQSHINNQEQTIQVQRIKGRTLTVLQVSLWKHQDCAAITGSATEMGQNENPAQIRMNKSCDGNPSQHVWRSMSICNLTDQSDNN